MNWKKALGLYAAYRIGRGNGTTEVRKEAPKREWPRDPDIDRAVMKWTWILFGGIGLGIAILLIRAGI